MNLDDFIKGLVFRQPRGTKNMPGGISTTVMRLLPVSGRVFD
jgi:hypothetical protein